MVLDKGGGDAAYVVPLRIKAGLLTTKGMLGLALGDDPMDERPASASQRAVSMGQSPQTLERVELLLAQAIFSHLDSKVRAVATSEGPSMIKHVWDEAALRF